MADPIIGEGVRIDGEVSADRDLFVAGEVSGRIRLAHQLVVRASGSVDADVEAEKIVVSGQAAGELNGRERVEVKASAKVTADVRTAALVVEEGAVFAGNVYMDLSIPEE